MATDELQKELADLNEWDENAVAEWLTKEGFAEHTENFKSNNIEGKVLPLLKKKDLKLLGMSKVGQRIKLLQRLSELQQAHMIAHRTKLLMRWSEYRLCPHPCKDIKYKLTPSAIEVDIDRSICGQTKHSIDVSQITDVQLHVPSCAAGCFYNSVFVETRSDAPLRMAVRSSQARQVFETIKNAWEGHQAAVANRRIGAF